MSTPETPKNQNLPNEPILEGFTFPETLEAQTLRSRFMGSLALKGSGLIDSGIDLGKRVLDKAGDVYNDVNYAVGNLQLTGYEVRGKIESKTNEVAAKIGKDVVSTSVEIASAVGTKARESWRAAGEWGRRSKARTAEAIRDGFDTAGVAIGGLGRAVKARAQLRSESGSVGRHAEDDAVYRQAGEVSRGSLGMPAAKEYNPLAKWDKKHRTKRSGFGFTTTEVPAWPNPYNSENPRARNIPQMQAELRNNRRADAINRLNTEIYRIQGLYGDDLDLSNKDAVKRFIKSHRIPRVEAKAIRSASKQVRKKQNVRDRVTTRLNNSAEGADVAGAYARTRSHR